LKPSNFTVKASSHLTLVLIGILISCLFASQYAMAANFTITRQPVSVTANAGATVQFSVGSSATGTVTYQWYKDGSAISNSNTRWLTITSFSSAKQGQYKVLVKNSSGGVYSNSATAKLSSTTTTPTTSTSTSGTGSATVSWTAPVKRTDGDSLTSREIKAFRVYHTISNSTYKKVYEIGASATTITIKYLGAGQHNFALTTVDTANLESKLSSIASKRIY
jgi:hypothetical protein